MIANVFVDSQDDIRLILLLMYKTIINTVLLQRVYFESCETGRGKWSIPCPLGFSSSLEMF